MKKFRLAVAFCLVALAGCRCGPPSVSTNRPDFDPSPKALSFEACPNQDEAGAAVKDVFPDEQKLKLINLGKASGAVQLSFSGTDATAFSVDAGSVPSDLGPGAEVELPVRFSPAKRGSVSATLTIEDGNEETDPVSVALVGTGRNLPSQPTIEVAVEDPAKPDTYLDATASGCYEGGSCTSVFPDTFYKDSSTLKVRVKNIGCPTLRITGIELQSQTGSGALAFVLDAPTIPPTEATPLLLTTADNNAETVLSVRFAPENDGSGIHQRYATLSLKTNDPAYPSLDITLLGSAADPSVYVTPTYCDFTDLNDTCGNVAKVANKGSFQVKNGGTVPITIDNVAFQKGGQGRFTISKNIQGQTLGITPPSDSAIIEVTHTDAPVYVSDVLTVTAKVGAKPAGTAFVSVSGGNQPCLSTEPLDQLDFQDPATELTSKTVTVKNGPPPCGDLVINRAFVDQSNFYSVVAPLVPAGQVVKASTSVAVTVQYKKPVSGGTQTGVLRIDSNDPTFGPPPYKVVLLYSNSPLDQLPTAVLKGCLPSDPTCANPSSGSMTVQLSTLNPKQLTLSGKESFDPGNASATPISAWRFRLVKKPASAGAATLENDGIKGTQNTSKLTLDPAALGIYVVSLLVWDDKSQQSPLASELTISVGQ